MSHAEEPHILDVRGLKCPLPVLRTRKALDGLDAGAVLEVWCTDPMAALDIPHLVHEQGDVLLDKQAAAHEGADVYRIRKA